MRGVLYVLSLATVALSAAAAVMFVHDKMEIGFAIAIVIMCLAGILWMLTKISLQLQELGKSTEPTSIRAWLDSLDKPKTEATSASAASGAGSR